jgi:hypothetical protein
MNARRVVLVAVVALFATAGYLPANPPPDPISVDAHSPSIHVCPAGVVNTADIYGLIGGTIGMGCDVAGPGPILHVPAPNYGVTAQDENDGHSAGERDPFAPVAVYFSGSKESQGVAGTEYAVQENNFQAAGDRFVTNGLTMQGPAASIPPPPSTVCGPPATLGPPFDATRPSVNLLSVNQDQYHLIPSLRPSVLNRGRELDNTDAVELQLFDVDGDMRNDRPIFFTVDKVSTSWLGRPSDILVTPPGGGFFLLFATAAQMGLNNRDNVDAVAVYDVDGDLRATAGVDYVVFSLDRGSPSLTGSPADLLVSDFSGRHCLFLAASSIGMERCDNVDAVDVENEVEIFEQAADEEYPGDPDEPTPVP